MNFLGSIGGLVHLLVNNTNKNYVSWDYQCKLDIEILMSDRKFTLNLTSVLDRACFLALNGEKNIKKASC
jgi:hypothetical protein